MPSRVKGESNGGATVRRLLALTIGVVVALALLPTGVSAHRSSGDLTLDVVKAPVAPDGTTAGAPLDFVVMFRNQDPDVDGVGMKAGGTITVELDAAFDLSGNQLSPPHPGGLPPPPAIVLQGWPQSPRVDFPYTTEIVGNTVMLTMTDDWAVGGAGPGPKALHLVLLASTNPAVPGGYSIDLAIRPDPGSPATLQGHGHVEIIPRVRPSVNVVSLFSGPPGPPPPFFNPLFQDLALGEDGRRVGMYLWERGGGAAAGVDVEMVNANHGRLVQDGRTVGHVHISAPKGASDHTLVSEGPSGVGPAFVTGIPTGILITKFTPDPTVAGLYEVSFSMNGGNTQTMRYDVAE